MLLIRPDLVPIREVAVWRGYVYAVNQVGRAVGPSLGGLIADWANWRWFDMTANTVWELETDVS